MDSEIVKVLLEKLPVAFIIIGISLLLLNKIFGIGKIFQDVVSKYFENQWQIAELKKEEIKLTNALKEKSYLEKETYHNYLIQALNNDNNINNRINGIDIKVENHEERLKRIEREKNGINN
jgi:hypothetical protein